MILTYVNDHLRKMKLNKSPGFDNISAEHLVYGGPILHVHLAVPLPRDKHGDTSRLDTYRGISRPIQQV